MQKYAQKQKIIGRVFLSIAIISLFLFFVFIFSFSCSPDLAGPLAFLSFWVSITFFITYFVKFFWFGHTFKILKKSGNEHYLDDIDLNTLTFAKSKIYCGKKAFFCKRTGSVVAYDQFAWIYNIGGHLGEHTIRFKNGKKAYIMIEEFELRTLLNNYISPVNSKIIEGKTVQAKKEFLKLYPEASSTLDKGKTIGGSILLAFALLSVIVGLIKNTIDVGGFVVIGVFGTIGLVLLIYGHNNVSITSLASSVQNKLSHSVFFNTLCKIGDVLGIVCMFLLIASGILKFEPLFIPAIIGYGVGMVFLLVSLSLRTGFFVKGMPTYSIKLPDEMLDDTSFITDVSVNQTDKQFLYTFRLTSNYGWDYIRDSVDYLFAQDLEKQPINISVGTFDTYTDITKSYLKGRKTGKASSDWARERGCAKIFGKSKSLKSFVSVIFYNQTQIVKLLLPLENKKIASAYIETLIRRSFGTPDQLKLAKPIPPRKPVTIKDENVILVDSAALVTYLKSHPQSLAYEFCGVIPLREKDPTIYLYEDGTKTKEYVLQTENDEDFTGKYFLISVRLSIHGNPAVPVAQIDGFVSDTPEERKMTMNDIGYRFEVHFLACGGEEGKQRYEMNRGQDLPMKALKYQGYTTPSNIRLIGVCPDCGKSFCFHGYAFYMMQSDVAYSDDGLDCCEIQAYDIDKDTWTYETEGKVFRYYNSFNCPHCGTPYIDYKKHPENKVFGVSGCVLLGKKHYQAK